MKLSRFPVIRDILKEQRRAWKFTIERPTTERRFRDWKSEQAVIGARENFFPHLGILFIHIPKTAGTSIHKFLTQLEDNHCQEPESTIKRPSVHKHATAAEWRSVLDDGAWDKCFSFCLVRNPFDLMVSSYFWWLQRAKKFPGLLNDALAIEELGSFDEFMKSRYGRYFINEIPAPMSDWYTYKRQDLVDYIGRVEDIENSMAHVIEYSSASAEISTIPRINASERSMYREYYTDKSRQIVEWRFADVIERFEYEF